MKKYREMVRKEKNNKGFSLVELIIVIAIMAALVVALAPQFLKYVERSRVASDENLMSEVSSALKVAVLDDDYTLVADDTVVISQSGITVTAQSGSGIINALQEYYGVTFVSDTEYKGDSLKSKSYTSATYTVTASGTYLTVTETIAVPTP